VNGYSGFVPADYVDQMAILNRFPDSDAQTLADALGVRYVILHTGRKYGEDLLTEPQAEAIVSRLPPTAHATRYGENWLIDLNRG
jgi:hypothetical protein